MADPFDTASLSEEDPYGGSRVLTILRPLFQHGHPDALAAATEEFLRRLTVLEMYVEEELGAEVSAEQLDEFVSRRHPAIQEETAKMAQLFFGRIASREG